MQSMKNPNAYHCPHCGSPARYELTDTDTRPRELLSCGCGAEMEFQHPPAAAALPLAGMGNQWARAIALAPWQARPRGLRRVPALARVLARVTGKTPPQTVQRWTWRGADW